MPIRIPTTAEYDVQTAFEDVQRELDALASLREELTALRRPEVEEETPLPTFDRIEGDVVIDGALRVNGDIVTRGAVDMPGTLGGFVGVAPDTITSPAQPVVEVHGSLAVLSGLSADSILARTATFLDGPVDVKTRLYTDTTDVGNVRAGEDTLMTFTVPPNTLTLDGQCLRVTAWGNFANNGDTKTIKAYFGSTSLTLAGPAGFVSLAWWMDLLVVRTRATSQVFIGRWFRNAGGTAQLTLPDEAAPTETLSGPVVLRLTGEGVSNNDILQKGMIVEVLL